MKNNTFAKVLFTKVNPNIVDIKLIWKGVLYICSYWFNYPPLYLEYLLENKMKCNFIVIELSRKFMSLCEPTHNLLPHKNGSRILSKSITIWSWRGCTFFWRGCTWNSILMFLVEKKRWKRPHFCFYLIICNLCFLCHLAIILASDSYGLLQLYSTWSAGTASDLQHSQGSKWK